MHYHSVVRHSSKTESVSQWMITRQELRAQLEARKESLKALLELFVPASDIVWGRAVVVHGVLVEVGGVEVGLDGGHNGGTQAAHPQSCNKTELRFHVDVEHFETDSFVWRCKAFYLPYLTN